MRSGCRTGREKTQNAMELRVKSLGGETTLYMEQCALFCPIVMQRPGFASPRYAMQSAERILSFFDFFDIPVYSH